MGRMCGKRFIPCRCHRIPPPCFSRLYDIRFTAFPRASSPTSSPSPLSIVDPSSVSPLSPCHAALCARCRQMPSYNRLVLAAVRRCRPTLRDERLPVGDHAQMASVHAKQPPALVHSDFHLPHVLILVVWLVLLHGGSLGRDADVLIDHPLGLTLLCVHQHQGPLCHCVSCDRNVSCKDL